MKRQKTRKIVITYLLVTIFCGVFSYIYEQFSHGVYSNYMTYLCLIPLIGGVIPFAIMSISEKIDYPSRFSLNSYNFGIATLTVGSCLKGVLDIYGTTSDLMPIYLIAGTILILVGILSYIAS